MPDNPRLKNSRSKDFKYIYSNGIGAQIGGGEATLIFGIKEDPSVQDDVLLEEIAVIMTIPTLKILSVTLSQIIENIERASNTKIPYDEQKFAALRKIIEDSTPTSSPTVSAPPS
jgi:hypothetical protein